MNSVKILLRYCDLDVVFVSELEQFIRLVKQMADRAELKYSSSTAGVQ